MSRSVPMVTDKIWIDLLAMQNGTIRSKKGSDSKTKSQAKIKMCAK